MLKQETELKNLKHSSFFKLGTQFSDKLSF